MPCQWYVISTRSWADFFKIRKHLLTLNYKIFGKLCSSPTDILARSMWGRLFGTMPSGSTVADQLAWRVSAARLQRRIGYNDINFHARPRFFCEWAATGQIVECPMRSCRTRKLAAGHGFGVPSTSPQCSAWTHGCNPPTAGSGAPASSSIGSDRAWNDFDDGALTKHKQDARSRPSWKSIDHAGNRSAGVFDARLGVARRARWYLFGTPDRIFADEDRPADDWTI